MISERFNERMAGMFYLVGTLLGVLSISTVIDGDSYLNEAASSANMVVFAGIMQLLMALCYLGFALCLVNVLKKYNRTLTYTFLTTRAIAIVCNVFGVAVILLLLKLSQMYVSNVYDTTNFAVLGELLRSLRDILNHVVMIIIHSIGGIALYLILFKDKLVQNWLAILGIISSFGMILLSLFVAFNMIEIVSLLYILCSFPIIIVEIIIAFKLVIRGLTS